MLIGMILHFNDVKKSFKILKIITMMIIMNLNVVFIRDLNILFFMCIIMEDYKHFLHFVIDFTFISIFPLTFIILQVNLYNIILITEFIFAFLFMNFNKIVNHFYLLLIIFLFKFNLNQLT